MPAPKAAGEALPVRPADAVIVASLSAAALLGAALPEIGNTSGHSMNAAGRSVSFHAIVLGDTCPVVRLFVSRQPTKVKLESDESLARSHAMHPVPFAGKPGMCRAEIRVRAYLRGTTAIT